jgi:hypothetical protein
VQLKKARKQVTTGTPSSPAFPARWCYGLFRALPGEPGFFATVVRDIVHELDPSVGGSGPHGFTVRRHDRSSTARCVHRIPPPYVRDDRDTPLMRRRDAHTQSRFSEVGKQNIFAEGLERRDRIESARKIGFSAQTTFGVFRPAQAETDRALRN